MIAIPRRSRGLRDSVKNRTSRLPKAISSLAHRRMTDLPDKYDATDAASCQNAVLDRTREGGPDVKVDF